MSIILTIILILVFLKIIRDDLFCLWLWQIKEYRTDRMRSYLRNKKDILSKNTNYLFALVLIFILCFSQQIPVYLVLIFFMFIFYQILIEIKNRTLKRPVPTFRILFTFSIIIIFYLLTISYWLYSFGITEEIVKLFLLFYLIIPVLVTAIILSTNPFFNFQKRKIIKKATDKMRGLNKIKVIGITGSYGKTSTKEFLYTILNQKYKVIKTEGNNNTNIGVAYTVLNKVNDDYNYFICEMGAYKIGEIKEMCEIVEPKIGILTGINEQHLELFGSIENTMKAKFELIESLPKSGLAIINKSIKYQVLSIKDRDIKHFSLSDVSGIKIHQNYVGFIYKDHQFRVNLLGKHYIENILSAILTAEYLGMNLEEISKASEKIKLSRFMMRKLDGPNSSIFVDDSYSANPDGVVAALDYLNEAYQNYQKIIVFPGIIELGNKSKELHQKLFSKIDKVCNIAYIMDQESIKSKVYKLNENNCKFTFEENFDKVVNMLKNDLNKNTVVLFESRGAGVVMKKII